jgi:hypothetical protein
MVRDVAAIPHVFPSVALVPPRVAAASAARGFFRCLGVCRVTLARRFASFRRPLIAPVGYAEAFGTSLALIFVESFAARLGHRPGTTIRTLLLCPRTPSRGMHPGCRQNAFRRSPISRLAFRDVRGRFNPRHGAHTFYRSNARAESRVRPAARASFVRGIPSATPAASTSRNSARAASSASLART